MLCTNKLGKTLATGCTSFVAKIEPGFVVIANNCAGVLAVQVGVFFAPKSISSVVV
jgi:acyl-CoA synthetase (NDP forming)